MTSSLKDKTVAWIFEGENVGRTINREAGEKSAVVRLKAQIIWEEYNCLAFRGSLEGFPRHWSQFCICLLYISSIDCRGEATELPYSFFFFFFAGNATPLIKDKVGALAGNLEFMEHGTRKISNLKQNIWFLSNTGAREVFCNGGLDEAMCCSRMKRWSDCFLVSAQFSEDQRWSASPS